jgi:Uncharacterized protein conserved in bacteria (DUF2188)
MSKKNNIHVVPNQGDWAVKQEGNPKPLSTHQTQGEAIQSGKQVAKPSKTELIIHRPNGEIRESWSYGKDPYPPAG